MNADNTIYIACLKYGRSKSDTGVSYNEMAAELKRQGLVRDIDTKEFNYYFYVWFFDNFCLITIYSKRQSGDQTAYHFDSDLLSPQGNKLKKDFNEILNYKCQMTYEAQQKYFEYLSLKESDRKADVAIASSQHSTTLTEASNRLSKTALGIAIVTMIISIAIGLWQIYYADKQDDFNQSEHATTAQTEEQQLQQFQTIEKQLQTLSTTLSDSVLQVFCDSTHQPVPKSYPK